MQTLPGIDRVLAIAGCICLQYQTNGGLMRNATTKDLPPTTVTPPVRANFDQEQLQLV